MSTRKSTTTPWSPSAMARAGGQSLAPSDHNSAAPAAYGWAATGGSAPGTGGFLGKEIADLDPKKSVGSVRKPSRPSQRAITFPSSPCGPGRSSDNPLAPNTGRAKRQPFTPSSPQSSKTRYVLPVSVLYIHADRSTAQPVLPGLPGILFEPPPPPEPPVPATFPPNIRQGPALDCSWSACTCAATITFPPPASQPASNSATVRSMSFLEVMVLSQFEHSVPWPGEGAGPWNHSPGSRGVLSIPRRAGKLLLPRVDWLWCSTRGPTHGHPDEWFLAPH